MAKRKPSSKTSTTKAKQAKPDDQAPAPRARKKAAGKETAPPHWQVAEPEDADIHSHFAKCTQCAAAVKFRRSATGAGIVVLERYSVDVETTFGIGPAFGNPICPNGHGEMLLADESLPVGEAMAQAARANGNDPAQAKLFDTSKPFNFEGAWMDVAKKSTEVSDLAREHEDDAARAKRSKKALEEAESLLRSMITTYDARRVQKERDEQRRTESAHSEEALVSRLAAVGVTFDVASTKALSAEHRNEIEAWLLDAEQHPDETSTWATWRPRGLGGAGVTESPTTVDGGVPAAEAPDVVEVKQEGDEASL